MRYFTWTEPAGPAPRDRRAPPWDRARARERVLDENCCLEMT